MKYIILLNVLVWGGALAALPDAINIEQSRNQAAIELHKDSLKTDNADDAYYQSEKYKVGKWANESLKRMKRDK